MTTKTTPNKSHSNKTVRLYSAFWKEKDGLGRMITGTYKHHDKQPVFTLITHEGPQVLMRDEWVVINERLAVWLDEYRLWASDKHLTEYRKGYCEALYAVIRHSLMD